MKKLKLCILFTCCFLILGMTGEKAYAQENTIPLNGEWISGSVTDDVCFYTFTLPSSGRLTYTFQSFSDNGQLCLKSQDLTKTYSRINCDGSSSNPEADSYTATLEKGTYILKVCHHNWLVEENEENWTGDYRLNVNFTPTNNNETEPNETFETAMDLTENHQILGLLSDSENDDYFKFTLESPQKIHIIYRFDEPFIFSLLDDNFLPIVEGNPYVPSSGAEEWVDYLEAGTYYINISKYWAGGIYTLNWFKDTPVSSIKLKTQKLTLSQKQSYNILSNVQPNTATNKTLKWTSSNSTVASVNGSGKITAKKAGSSVITAASQDGSKISARCTVIVKPQKQKITKLSCNASDARKINIQLSKQTGVSGYQIVYSTDKNFKNKRSLTSKYTSTVTGKLIKNKKYYFKARAYYTYENTRHYGTWSDVKTITPKKH